MWSVSRAAAVAVLVVGAGDIFAQFALRREVRRADFNDVMYQFADTARQVHVVALMLAVAALAVALLTGGRPGWHWLAWGLFGGWVVYAYLTAEAAPRMSPDGATLYATPPASLRDEVLHSLDATVPTYVDLLGAVLLLVAVTLQVRRGPGRIAGASRRSATGSSA